MAGIRDSTVVSPCPTEQLAPPMCSWTWRGTLTVRGTRTGQESWWGSPDHAGNLNCTSFSRW